MSSSTFFVATARCPINLPFPQTPTHLFRVVAADQHDDGPDTGETAAGGPVSAGLAHRQLAVPRQVARLTLQDAAGSGGQLPAVAKNAPVGRVTWLHAQVLLLASLPQDGGPRRIDTFSTVHSWAHPRREEYNREFIRSVDLIT
jgi:hypothetical protein